MAFQLQIINEENEKNYGSFNKLPDTCPICLKGIDPRFKTAYEDSYIVQVVMQCPRNECHSFFIAYYGQQIVGPNSYVLKSIRPRTPEHREFSDYILEITNDFCVIYNEAFIAEQTELDQIAGVGYRKALEYLIKDFAIYCEPDEGVKEKIKNKWLSVVIDDHIESEKIKSTSKMAAWLGNDETHYMKKWSEMDVKDLKNLIELTIRWIEMELMTSNYSDKMLDDGDK